MTQPSPDARAVVRAFDALTTQVRRLADQLTEGSRQSSYALAPPVVGTDDAPTTPTLVCSWAHTRYQHSRHDWTRQPGMAPVHCPGWSDGDPEPAPAADEDAQRSARRVSIRVLLNRLNNGLPLGNDETQLLTRHVATEITDANDGHRRAEQAEDLLRVAHETSNRSEAERARAAERADRAEAERDQAQAILRQMLGSLVETERRSGAPCRRTMWISEQIVQRWRAVLPAEPGATAPWWEQLDAQRAELEQAQATVERVRTLASRWAVLRTYGSAATELRAALDTAERFTTTKES